MIKKGLFIFVVIFSFFSTNVFAEDFDYYDYEIAIRDYVVDIEVNENGSIDVVEKILYDFGDDSRHGIIRDLPIIYGDFPEEVEILVDVEKVTDENGVPYEYDVSDLYYGLEVKIGSPIDYVSGENWYYINYKAHDVVNGFLNYDELYWNATGTEWDVPIDQVSVNVKIPDGGTIDKNLASCFSGYFGENFETCTAEIISENEFHFEVTDLYAYNGLTIVSGFQKGLVTTPGTIKLDSFPSFANIYLNGEKTIWTTPTNLRLGEGEYFLEVKLWKYGTYSQRIILRSGEVEDIFVSLQKNPIFIILDTYLPVLLFLFGIGAIFLFWWFRGRDPEGRGTIMPFYKAPKLEGKDGKLADPISPGELGVLIDEKAHLHDITGSIIQLAVKGLIKIKKDKIGKDKKGKAQKPTAKNYTFVKLRDPKKGELVDFEKKIFDAIFQSLAKGKKEVRLDHLSKKFYKKLPKIKELLYKHVVDQGYFSNNPEEVRGHYGIGGILFIIVSLIFGGIMAAILDTGAYLYLLPLIGVVMIIFSSFMPKKTKAGVEVYEKVLGYKMFLNAAEKDRIKVLFSPKEYKDVFAENLPYAMVMEVEKQWAKQFKGLYDAVPDWYEGDDNLIAFASSMGTFSNVAQAAYISLPTPKGGSYSGKSGGWGSGWSGGGSSSWSGGSGFSGGFSGGGFGGGGGSSW